MEKEQYPVPPSETRRGGNNSIIIHPAEIDTPNHQVSPAMKSSSSPSPVVFGESGHFKKWWPWLIPAFVIANVVMFIITMYVNNCPKKSLSCIARFLGRFSFQPFKENPLLGPSSMTLQKMGALDVKKVVDGHQGWRLISCNWLHGGVFHLLANMLSLLVIGIRLEQEFGFVKVGLLYIISGFGGSLLSALFIQSNISVGASGALFGLLGGMLSELITNWTIYANKVAAFITLVVIIVVNLAVGILPHVDNFAHIGGFLSGFLLGFVFLIRPQFGWLSQGYAPLGILCDSIAEYSVNNSIIKPTYMLTYESASELLHMNLEEEAELKLLSEAASLRLQWRREQGAVDTATIETRIKVPNPEDPEPSINLYVENQADPAMRLVSEMMLLCGEAIATFGSCNNIPLPYRGQPQSNIDVSAFAHLPEGPVRSLAMVRIMRSAEIDLRKPIRHGILGLPGYVQFTSPIRRYLDLLAHYQVKAVLRGDSPPLSAGQLEGMASLVNMQTRVVRRLCSSSLQYWIIEFLRRQPKEKKYRALILRFIKDRVAALLLVEVGLQASAWVSLGTQIGDEVQVRVEEAHPRDDIISLKEVVV